MISCTVCGSHIGCVIHTAFDCDYDKSFHQFAKSTDQVNIMPTSK